MFHLLGIWKDPEVKKFQLKSNVLMDPNTAAADAVTWP